MAPAFEKFIFRKIFLLIAMLLVGNSILAAENDLPLEGSYSRISSVLAKYTKQNVGGDVSESLILRHALGRLNNSLDRTGNTETIQIGGSSTPIITSRSEATVDEACLQIEAQVANGQINAPVIAEMFMLADEQAEEDIVAHYYKLFDELDEDEKTAIQTEIAQLKGDNSITEFKTDFVAYSLDYPDEVFNAFKKGCGYR